MSRLQPLDPAALEPEQRALFEAITGGRRAKDREAGSLFYEDGSLIGPFNPWLHHPPIGQRAQRLGEVLRYQGTLAPRLREVAILTVAAEWRSQFEWWAHRRIALEVGLSEETIAAIKAGRSPEDGTEDEQLVYHFAAALLENRRVSTATYRATAQRLGDHTIVELVSLLGYYVLVSMTLNAFEVPMPAGEPPPFADQGDES